MALTKTPIELSSTPSIVDGGNATAITIDDSENVTLAGTATMDGLTVTSSSSNAGTFKAVGGYALQAYQDATSADHTALDLRSDHVSGGTNRYLIRGYNTAAGTPAESFNVNTAGGAYFAGGAYLGGTGAANKLDDYEEGTWSLTSSATITNTIVAQYVRIGRLVTGVVDVQLASGQTSNVALDFNVPLTLDGNYGAGVVNYTNGSLVAEPLTVNPDPVNKLYIRYAHQNNATIAQFTGSRIIFNFTYFTNA